LCEREDRKANDEPRKKSHTRRIELIISEMTCVYYGLESEGWNTTTNSKEFRVAMKRKLEKAADI
jgi:hypothetical protein